MASHIQNNRKLADLEHVSTKCIILCNYVLFCVYATKIRSIVVKLAKRKKGGYLDLINPLTRRPFSGNGRITHHSKSCTLVTTIPSMFETARNITLGEDISYRGRKKNSLTLKASQPSSATLYHCTSLSAIDSASALRAPRRRIFSLSRAGRSSSSRMGDQDGSKK
jgi:hypothetical protein